MGYANITPAEAKRKLDTGGGIILVDVRSTGEYGRKHIPGSKLIPLDTLEREAPSQLQDKQAVIIVHCAAGSRSKRAAASLARMGYQQVFNLVGGINAWPYETE